MSKKKVKVVWKGNLKEGHGNITLLNCPVSKALGNVKINFSAELNP